MNTTSNNELPHFNPYDRSYFYKFSISDFLVDVLLIVFSTLASHQLFSKNGLFFHLETWQIIGMYCIVVLTVPWYLGYIYVRNSAFYSKNMMRVFLWIFILMVFMILVYLVRFVNESDQMKMYLDNTTEFTSTFAIFLLVFGPMMCLGGAAAAQEEFRKKSSEASVLNPQKDSATRFIFILLLSIAMMLLVIALLPRNTDFWVPIVGFISGPILAAIIYGVYLKFLSLLNKFGIYKYLSLIAQNTFPFFIISVLVFWSGVAIYFMQNDFGNGGKISVSGMLFSVCVSGLVPFRIIMMFNAPLRITHIGLGVLSLSYFLWNLFALIK